MVEDAVVGAASRTWAPLSLEMAQMTVEWESCYPVDIGMLVRAWSHKGKPPGTD